MLNFGQCFTDLKLCQERVFARVMEKEIAVLFAFEVRLHVVLKIE